MRVIERTLCASPGSLLAMYAPNTFRWIHGVGAKVLRLSYRQLHGSVHPAAVLRSPLVAQIQKARLEPGEVPAEVI